MTFCTNEKSPHREINILASRKKQKNMKNEMQFELELHEVPISQGSKFKDI